MADFCGPSSARPLELTRALALGPAGALPRRCRTRIRESAGHGPRRAHRTATPQTASRSEKHALTQGGLARMGTYARVLDDSAPAPSYASPAPAGSTARPGKAAQSHAAPQPADATASSAAVVNPAGQEPLRPRQPSLRRPRLAQHRCPRPQSRGGSATRPSPSCCPTTRSTSRPASTTSLLIHKELADTCAMMSQHTTVNNDKFPGDLDTQRRRRCTDPNGPCCARLPRPRPNRLERGCGIVFSAQAAF